MHELDLYQEELLLSGATKIAQGKRRIVFQLSTGGGKTVIFSTATKRFIEKSTEDVLIMVNRKELLKGTIKTLYNWYGIISCNIHAGNKDIKTSRVYVAMVQTLNNRLKNPAFLKQLGNVGMIIADECHLSDFKKIFPLFKQDYIKMGFTATPIAATKKDPLINHYDDIVVGPPISELIALNKINPKRGLVQNRTYSVNNDIDNVKFKVKNGEYDEKFMGDVLSGKKQVQNTIDAYIKFGYGTKAFCYNANIEHSKLVNKAFIEAGFPSRHIDGSTVPLGPHLDDDGVMQPAEYDWLPDGWKGDYNSWRDSCFEWFEKTPGAILNNVGIATTGTDVPSCQTIIVNSKMMSVVLWLQKCGRGARPYQFPDGTFKEYFTIIDLGGNAKPTAHGDWCDDRDWGYIFKNPKKPTNGVAPSKICPECDYMNHASVSICKGQKEDDLFGMVACGYEFPAKEHEIDEKPLNFVLITKGIDVQKTINFFADRSEYFSMFEMIKHIAAYARKEFDHNELTFVESEQIFTNAYDKVKEWCKLKGKRNNGWYNKTCRSKLKEELIKLGFVIPEKEIQFEL